VARARTTAGASLEGRPRLAGRRPTRPSYPVVCHHGELPVNRLLAVLRDREYL